MSVEAFTHLDEHGSARMVDVTEKAWTGRRAVARCSLISAADLSQIIATDDLTAAETAGRQAAKRTSLLIPLCHPLPLDDVCVRVSVDGPRVDIEAEVQTFAQTGVEMEALTTALTAALLLFHVVVSRDPSAQVQDLAVWSKAGGKSGPWGRATNRSR